MRAGRLCIAARFSRYAGLLAFMISMAYLERADGFGIVSRVTKQVFPGIQDSMSDFAEAMNGEIYANALLNQDETDSMVGETDKLLVSALPSLPLNRSMLSIDVDFPLSESVSPCSPPLTFAKFLTMQVFFFWLPVLFNCMSMNSST